ncbi:hypothetical protein L1887_00909 [Cichorium endivia]|nr:hypothetical protein L1887_00909 [Cichorium endivia]
MAILNEMKPGDYGDITKFSEQEFDTRDLGVSRTQPISGICSSDRGRHVIKKDGQIWSQMKDELRNWSELVGPIVDDEMRFWPI